jgi:glycosyltransferase involved in cell wall biosynthesis
MTRVLHVSASFPRHVEDPVAPFLLDLVEGQRAHGWAPSVLAVHDAGLPARHELAGVPVRRVRYGPDRWEVLAYRGGGHGGLRSPLHALLLPGLLVVLVLAVRAEVRRARPDVVHAHWILPGGLAAAVALLLLRRDRPRLVLTMHGTDVELAAGRLRPLARWVAGRADAVLAVSEPLARRAEEVLGLRSGMVGVGRIPLPVALTASPLPAGARRVLAAGRASPEKGFDVLLAALARPAAADVRATLVVDGPARAALDAQVAELELGDRVELRPLVPRRELFELMRTHHLVVVPSRSEGLGMVALEALALGRPVVASAVGGLPEVVAAGVDGALVPADDPDALAAAIASVPLVAPTAAAAAPHRPDAVLAAHRAAYGLPADAAAAAPSESSR